MTSFLWWIGWYNFLGSIVLALMYHERLADFMLRKVTEVVLVPYEHGAFGRMWLWWAASTNLFLGAIMLRAASWSPEPQREVAIAIVAVYVLMYLVMAIGMRPPKYSWRGAVGLHVLWLLQIGWGGWSIYRAAQPLASHWQVPHWG
jgi:hypothetical protein